MDLRRMKSWVDLVIYIDHSCDILKVFFSDIFPSQVEHNVNETQFLFICSFIVILFGKSCFIYVYWKIYWATSVRCSRNSLPEMFCKTVALSNFAKFTGKHLCQSLFSNKDTGLKPATLLKKRLWHSCFPVNFVKFRRTPFFTEHPRWLFLMFLNQSSKKNVREIPVCRLFVYCYKTFFRILLTGSSSEILHKVRVYKICEFSIFWIVSCH